jgi:hypothetical protein
MYQQLRIAGDPTTWVLSEPIEDTALTQASAPFQAEIIAPLAGTLILSVRAAASVVLYNPPGGVIPSGATPGGVKPSGVIPSGASPLTPCLYLPTATGLSIESPGYPLPVAPALPALASEITAAISQEKPCTVAFGVGSAGGLLVLNGAALPFAVLFTAASSG